MYPLGILFGLGFDTSSEIALLGISSIQGARGTSIWLILIFPALFTAGMCLLDTIDGALMLSLYTSANLAKDPVAILYYNVILTGVTIIVAVAIGSLQVLGLAATVATNPTGKFWDGVQSASDHYDIIGGGICGFFVLAGVLSVVLYGPWRRWVDKGRPDRNADAGVLLVDVPSGEVIRMDESVNKNGSEVLPEKKNAEVVRIFDVDNSKTWEGEQSVDRPYKDV